MERGSSIVEIVNYHVLRLSFVWMPGRKALIGSAVVIVGVLSLGPYSFSGSLYSTYISEGMSFYKLGEYDKSMEFFRKAIELNPNDPLPYRMVGLCNYRKNFLDEAVRYLCISLTLEEGDNVVTLSILGNIYYKQKKYNNSAMVYERLLSLTNSAFVCHRLMVSLEKTGRIEEAVSVGEKFLLSPQWNEFDEELFKATLRRLYVKFGNRLKEMGLREKAENFFEKARKLK